VAVRLEKGHPSVNESHTVVWRNNAMRIDQHDRKAERNITLGSKTTIVASGRGSATAHPNRVQVRVRVRVKVRVGVRLRVTPTACRLGPP